jgi:hypothetical protein
VQNYVAILSAGFSRTSSIFNDDTGTCLSWFFAEEGVMTESIFDLHAHMERERLLGSSLAMYKRMIGEFYAEYVIQVLP